MAKSLKDTIIALKQKRDRLRNDAARLGKQADDCSAQAYGLSEAIDALEPWARAGEPEERAPGGSGVDPEGRHRPDPTRVE